MKKANPYWNAVPGNTDAAKLRKIDSRSDYIAWFIETQRQKVHTELLTDTEKDPPVLVAACRPDLGIDPIVYLPMSLYTRSRLIRWRMGWLPGRPTSCTRCNADHASRNHLVACLDVATRLGVPTLAAPNPIDYFLNKYLPLSKVKNPLKALTPDEIHLCNYWPVLCTILYEIEQICLPNEDFSLRTEDSDSHLLIRWFKHRPRPRIQTSRYIQILEANASTPQT